MKTFLRLLPTPHGQWKNACCFCRPLPSEYPPQHEYSPAVINAARANQEVIITHDLDYGHLLAFAGARVPSVIIIRLTHPSAPAIASALAAAWPALAQPLTEGALVIIEDAAVRIRLLRIASQS